MAFEVTRYTRYDRDEVQQLFATSRHAHQHLDWRSVEGWLDDPGSTIRLARAGARVVGCLAACASYNGVSWLRLIAVADDQSVPLLLDAMWPQVRASLADYNVRQVGVLIVRPWLLAYLPGLGFRQTNRVITLARTGARLPPRCAPICRSARCGLGSSRPWLRWTTPPSRRCGSTRRVTCRTPAASRRASRWPS
ncbi:MAG: hypothetical protein M5R40_04295 [Anaerolineae bacterium]|nr:hypothetical protein [Anaerolineae bacterium]